MSKPKDSGGTFKGIAISAPGKIQNGYQGPRGNLGTPPTGNGGGSSGNSGSGNGGPKK